MNVGPPPLAGPRGGLGHHRVAGQHVVAVHPHARACRSRWRGGRATGRRAAVAPAPRWPTGCSARRTRTGAPNTAARLSASCASPSRGGAVAEERHRHRVLAEPLRGHRRPDRVQALGADGDGDRRAAPAGERRGRRASGPATPPPTSAGGDAADEERAEFAVLREEPVGLAQTRHGADLRRLLAAAGGEQRELPLTLQVDEFGVDLAGDDHRLVEPGQGFGREVSRYPASSVGAPSERHRRRIGSTNPAIPPPGVTGGGSRRQATEVLGTKAVSAGPRCEACRPAARVWHRCDDAHCSLRIGALTSMRASPRGLRDDAFGAPQHGHVDHLTLELEDAPFAARSVQDAPRPVDLLLGGRVGRPDDRDLASGGSRPWRRTRPRRRRRSRPATRRGP